MDLSQRTRPMLKVVKPMLGIALAGLVSSAHAQSAPAPSFSKDILPIFRARCVACHMTGNEPGNLSLTPSSAYAQLLKPSLESTLQRVHAGKPEQSYLIYKLRGTQAILGGQVDQMPLGGPTLEPNLIGNISQ